MSVDATPSEVRGLAMDLLRGMKALLEVNGEVESALGALAATFQDDGYESYREMVARIQKKLESICEGDLEKAVNSLQEFASLLEQAKGIV